MNPYGSGYPANGQNYQGQPGMQQGMNPGAPVHPGAMSYPGTAGYYPGVQPGYPGLPPGTYPQQQAGYSVQVQQQIKQADATAKDKKAAEIQDKAKKKKKKIIAAAVILGIVAIFIVIQVISMQVPKTHTITLNLNGGILDNKNNTYLLQDLKDNQRATRPKNPVKQGYTFEGWFREPSFQNKWDWSSDKVKSDMNLYAKWSALSITVNFDPKEGISGIDGGTDFLPIQVVFNEPYGKDDDLPEPIRLGYNFAGWYTKDGDLVTSETLVSDTQPHLLTAKWVGRPVQVSLEINVDTYFTSGEPPIAPVISETIHPVRYREKYGKIPAPTWAGWDFAGWFTTPKGPGTEIDETTEMRNLPVSSDGEGYGYEMSIYARWKPSEVKFALTANEKRLTAATYNTEYAPEKQTTFPAAYTETDKVVSHFTYTAASRLPAGLVLSPNEPRITGKPAENAGSNLHTFTIVARHVNHPSDIIDGITVAIPVEFSIEIQKKALTIPTLVKDSTEAKPTSPITTTEGTFIAFTYEEGVVHKVKFDSVGQDQLKDTNPLRTDPHTGETDYGALFRFDESLLAKENSSVSTSIPGNKYEIIITINEPMNYYWLNQGQTITESRSWIIDRKEIAKPTLETGGDLAGRNGQYVYDGELKRAALRGKDADGQVRRLPLNGNRYSLKPSVPTPTYIWQWTGAGSESQRGATATGQNPGGYASSVVMLASNNYKWEGSGFPGSHSDLTITPWKIEKAKLYRPEMRYTSPFVKSAAPDSREETPSIGYIYNGVERRVSTLLKGKKDKDGNLQIRSNLSVVGETFFNGGEVLDKIPTGPIGSVWDASKNNVPLYSYVDPENTMKKRGACISTSTTVTPYAFEVALADTLNYEWADLEKDVVDGYNPKLGDGIQNLTYHWYIRQFEVTAPRYTSNSPYRILGLRRDDGTLKGATHVYDGREKNVTLCSNAPMGIPIQDPVTKEFTVPSAIGTQPLYDFVENTGTGAYKTTRTAAGVFDGTGTNPAGVRVALRDNTNCRWKDTSSLPEGMTVQSYVGYITFEWGIEKAKLRRPELRYAESDNASFANGHDGRPQTYAAGYIYNGHERQASFLVYGAPRTNVFDAETDFNSSKVLGVIPQGPIGASETSNYNASTSLFTVSYNNGPTGYLSNVGGHDIQTAINNGTYSFNVTIADKANYEWAPYTDVAAHYQSPTSAGTNNTDNLAFTWKIRKLQVSAPAVLGNIKGTMKEVSAGVYEELTYDGTKHSLSLVNRPVVGSVRVCTDTNPANPVYENADFYEFVSTSDTWGWNAKSDYLLNIEFADKYGNLEWKDVSDANLVNKTDKSGQLKFSWAINTKKIEAPTLNDIIKLRNNRTQIWTNWNLIEYNGFNWDVYLDSSGNVPNNVPINTTGNTNRQTLDSSDFEPNANIYRFVLGETPENHTIETADAGAYRYRIEFADQANNFEWVSLGSATPVTGKPQQISYNWEIKLLSIPIPKHNINIFGLSDPDSVEIINPTYRGTDWEIYLDNVFAVTHQGSLQSAYELVDETGQRIDNMLRTDATSTGDTPRVYVRLTNQNYKWDNSSIYGTGATLGSIGNYPTAEWDWVIEKKGVLPPRIGSEVLGLIDGDTGVPYVYNGKERKVEFKPIAELPLVPEYSLKPQPGKDYVYYFDTSFGGPSSRGLTRINATQTNTEHEIRVRLSDEKNFTWDLSNGHDPDIVQVTGQTYLRAYWRITRKPISAPQRSVADGDSGAVLKAWRGGSAQSPDYVNDITQSFTFDGSAVTLRIDGAERGPAVIVGGQEPTWNTVLYDFQNSISPSATDAGNYSATVVLSDTLNYMWKDVPAVGMSGAGANGNSNNLVYSWSIATLKVTLPTVEVFTNVLDDISYLNTDMTTKQFTTLNITEDYNGYQQKISLEPDRTILRFPDANGSLLAAYVYEFVRGGVISSSRSDPYKSEVRTDAMDSAQVHKIRLRDQKNTEWISGGTDELTINWWIKKAEIVNPTAVAMADALSTANGNVVTSTYDGMKRTLSLADLYDSNPNYALIKVNGSYFPADPDGSPIPAYGFVLPGTAELPGSPDPRITYGPNGVDDQIHPQKLFYSTLERTNAGSGNTQVSLIIQLLDKSNFVWADSKTSADIEFKWNIQRAPVAIPHPASAVFNGIQNAISVGDTAHLTLANPATHLAIGDLYKFADLSHEWGIMVEFDDEDGYDPAEQKRLKYIAPAGSGGTEAKIPFELQLCDPNNFDWSPSTPPYVNPDRNGISIVPATKTVRYEAESGWRISVNI